MGAGNRGGASDCSDLLISEHISNKLSLSIEELFVVFTPFFTLLDGKLFIPFFSQLFCFFLIFIFIVIEILSIEIYFDTLVYCSIGQFPLILQQIIVFW